MNSPVSRPAKINKVVIEEIHCNTSQEIIEITTDKLKLILSEHLNSLEKTKEWQTPLSLLIGIILVFCTADFKTAFGLTAATWSAVFFISGAICLLWLINTARQYSSAMSLNDLLDVIKNKT